MHSRGRRTRRSGSFCPDNHGHRETHSPESRPSEAERKKVQRRKDRKRRRARRRQLMRERIQANLAPVTESQS